MNVRYPYHIVLLKHLSQSVLKDLDVVSLLIALFVESLHLFGLLLLVLMLANVQTNPRNDHHGRILGHRHVKHIIGAFAVLLCKPVIIGRVYRIRNR